MGLHISDINKRQRIIDHSSYVICKVDTIPVFTESGSVKKENASYILNHWDQLDESDSSIAFLKALDVFDAICESSCNKGELDSYFNILYEGVNKVRDAVHLSNSIKHRTSRFKTKISTRINNSIDKINGANTAKINNISNQINKAIGSMSSSPIPSQDNSGVAKQEAYYEKLAIRVKELSECDRIIRNYNKISKRFNFDRMVNELCSEDFIYDCVIEMCRCIDTYDTSLITKYEVSLENVYYVLNKNHMNYPKDKVIESVTDYFIIEKSTSKSELIDLVNYIKENSVIFDEANFNNIDNLIKKSISPKDDVTMLIDPSSYGIDFAPLTEANLKDKLKEKLAKIKKPTEQEKNETKEMIDEFRKSCMNMEKDEKEDKNILTSKLNKLKEIIKKIYTKNPVHIANGLPNILTIIRVFFVLSPMALYLVLGLLSLLVDQCTKLTLERDNLDKMIKAYEKEINIVKTKIDKTKSSEDKNNLQKYLDELKKDLAKVKQYEDKLYSDEANEKRHEEDDDYKFDDDFDTDDDDWDEDDENWDMDFDESQKIQASSIMLLSEMVDSINESLLGNNINDILYDNIFKFDNDTLDNLTDFSITVPVILEKEKLKEAMVINRDQLRKQRTKNVDDFIRIDCLSQNIYKLENSTKVYNVSTDMKSLICTLNCLNELATFSTSKYLIEMDLTNTIKLAMNRLKKTAVNLDTKQKQISNSIDVSMRNISKGIEDSMMNDSREAIIRGSVLPSASKVIKMAITTGAAWLINPAIAVIGALGAFACSSKLKAKERQLVLDDIEIELKMCERYLRQAEDKNDMKAIRQIETTQRSLLRQQQRIKYKMNVVYKQKVPDVKSSDY